MRSLWVPTGKTRSLCASGPFPKNQYPEAGGHLQQRNGHAAKSFTNLVMLHHQSVEVVTTIVSTVDLVGIASAGRNIDHHGNIAVLHGTCRMRRPATGGVTCCCSTCSNQISGYVLG